MIFCAGGTDFEVEVLRDRILEAGPLLSHLTADLGGEEEGTAEGFGWAEGEDLEERIWEASRVTSTVEGPRITRWTGLTLRSNSGVSQLELL